MHPSFGIEFICTSTSWKDVIQGPSQSAVLAHTYKVLHYRSLLETGGVDRRGNSDDPAAGREMRALAGDRPLAA